jgi:predicted nucleotidyltransferase
LSSERSDYDAFFIFAQPPADYALGGATETYTKEIPPEESLLDTEIELHGWNLRRFIGNDGLAGSNPTAIEFCLSSETYFSNSEDGSIHLPLINMMQHTLDSFKPYALINHYRSLAASNYGKYIEGDYKLASDTSWGDLMYPAEPSWGAIAHDSTEGLAVDEQETTIGEDEINVYGSFEQTPYLGSIDTERAEEDGLIEPTTTDRTIKRHLNIAQALIKARYIEEEHSALTMWFPDLLARCADREWLPEQVYAEIGDLIAKKKNGAGEATIGTNWALHNWIEDELSRDIEPQGHVERQPETARIRGEARELYNALDWAGI